MDRCRQEGKKRMIVFKVGATVRVASYFFLHSNLYNLLMSMFIYCQVIYLLNQRILSPLDEVTQAINQFVVLLRLFDRKILKTI